MKKFRELITSPIYRQILVAVGPISITGILGMTSGFSATMLPQLEHPNSTIKTDEVLSSWIASMSSLPMAPGCIIGGYLMEILGRRNIHIITCIPLVLGWFLIALAPNATFILIGRFLAGITDGILGAPTGVYIAETTQPNARGVLIMMSYVAITFGLLSVHLLGTFSSWRVTAWISGLLPIPCAIFMCFMPESPTFLTKQNKIEEAKRAFRWCRGTCKESEKELNQLIERQQLLNNAPKQSFRQRAECISKPEFWKPTILVSVMFIAAQINGNNAMSAYTIKILQECGLSGEMFNEYVAMIAIDTARLTAASVSCILVNRMARRSLMMMSGYGVILTLFCLSGYLYLAPKLGFDSSILLLVMLVVYVCLFAVGLVPLSGTLMGEMFPLAYRGLGTGITSLVCYFVLYMVVKTFPTLLTFFGSIIGVFIFYGLSTLIVTIVLTIYLPETKDKPLYVIEDYFKSNKCRRQGSFGSSAATEY